MADDSSDHEVPTRRDYMKYGGAVVGGTLLAGCAGQSDSESTPTETATETSTPEDESYSVTMSPVGTVEFDAPPESMIAFDRQWLHMAYELGHGDAVSGFARPDSTRLLMHEMLPGVSFETDQIQTFYGERIDKELIYEIDPDLIAMDPYRAPTLDGLDERDVEELRETVAPFFANRYSVTRDYPGNNSYKYYTLYDLYEKFGKAFQEQERVEALREIDRNLTETIQSDLPPKEDRPTVMKEIYYEGGEFYVYDIEKGGYGTRHYRNAGARSAIRERYGDDVPFEFGSKIDMETLIEIDPDVLIEANTLFFSNLEDWSHEGLVEGLKNEPGAQELTAVQNGAHYPGGSPYVGPVAYLFYTELLAKYLYPEKFGEFPGLNDKETWEIPEEEQLFDRQRVADIINGNL